MLIKIGLMFVVVVLYCAVFRPEGRIGKVIVFLGLLTLPFWVFVSVKYHCYEMLILSICYLAAFLVDRSSNYFLNICARYREKKQRGEK